MASNDLKWPLRSLLRSSAPLFVGSRKLFVFHNQVSIWPLKASKWQFKAKQPQKWPQMTSEVKVSLQWLALLFDFLQMLFYVSMARNEFQALYLNLFVRQQQQDCWAVLDRAGAAVKTCFFRFWFLEVLNSRNHCTIHPQISHIAAT